MDHQTWSEQERDRREIDELIKRYFLSFDRQEPAMLDDIFSADGELWVEGRMVRGPKADRSGALPKGISAKPIGFNHVRGQSVVELMGDMATGETNAIGYLVMDGDPPRMLVRGLRYLDRFVRTAAGWRIAERHHNVDWMFEADATIAVARAERLQLADLPWGG